jgi:DNA invertase Pin-like site-specific DNA recombinase
VTKPLPPNQLTRRAKPTPELLAQAKELLEDGASLKEAHRTTGISMTTLHRKFPGKGWTYKQGGEYRQLLKHCNVKDL